MFNFSQYIFGESGKTKSLFRKQTLKFQFNSLHIVCSCKNAIPVQHRIETSIQTKHNIFNLSI